MDTGFKLLPRFFIHMRRTQYGINRMLGRYGNRTRDNRTRRPCCPDDLIRRFVNQIMIVGFQTNSDILSCHLFTPSYLQNIEHAYKPCTYLTISVTTPAPTVRPPSRIAKRNSFSMAISFCNSTSTVMLSPGITISTPAGNVTEPVTSVVRK